MYVSQVIINGKAVGGSGSSRKIWWSISGICFALFLLMVIIDDTSTAIEQYEECLEGSASQDQDRLCDQTEFEDEDSIGYALLGGGSCCFSLIAGIIAISHGSKKSTVIVQQIPQMYTQPVIQQVVQQPVQQTQGQMPVQRQPHQNKHPQSTGPNPQMMAQQAKNLEMARDFKGAAEMYQKAGLFAEAGRIRQEFLEKDDKPMVQIGQVGDSVVKDSVVMSNTNQEMVCKKCNAAIQPDWKFCPSCNQPI